MASMERNEIDYISELPDYLIHDIFSHMESDDVVKTCVLSKRWRYLWASSPFIDFTFLNNSFSQKTESTLINFICQFLLRRNSVPIINFAYKSYVKVDASLLHAWISYALNHNVKNLSLMPICRNIPLEFPNYIPGYQSLQRLKIDGCDVFDSKSLILPNVLDLPSLQILDLVNFGNFDGSCISSFPNLKTLRLENIRLNGIPNFKVFASNLENFALVNYPVEFLYSHCDIDLVTPKLIDFEFDGYRPFISTAEILRSLERISISLPCYSELMLLYSRGELEKLTREVLRMFDAFHRAKTITLSISVIQLLSRVPFLLKERPSKFPYLESLVVKTDDSCKNLDIPSSISDYFHQGSSLL